LPLVTFWCDLDWDEPEVNSPLLPVIRPAASGSEWMMRQRRV
jgi:hypothetical protein